MSRTFVEKQREIPKERDSQARQSFSNSRMGFLTEKQFQVLSLRSRGYTQLETSLELRISRSSVSMVEARARKQVQRARQTLKLFEMTQTQRIVAIGAGTRLQQIPLLVLQEADRYNVHLRKNMVEILRMVKKEKPRALTQDERTVKKIFFSFNERGKISLK